jgi:hypothetical protein
VYTLKISVPNYIPKYFDEASFKKLIISDEQIQIIEKNFKSQLKDFFLFFFDVFEKSQELHKSGHL